MSKTEEIVSVIKQHVKSPPKTYRSHFKDEPVSEITDVDKTYTRF